MYEVECAYHFTNFADFLKIAESGALLSRSLARFRGGGFSHNGSLTSAMIAKTDGEVLDYARLALNPDNRAFYYFRKENGKFAADVQLCFDLSKVHKLPRIRLSNRDEPAYKLKFTDEMYKLTYEDFLEKVKCAAQFKMAELLVYGEVPTFCLSEVVINCPDGCGALLESAAFCAAEEKLTAQNVKITVRRRK